MVFNGPFVGYLGSYFQLRTIMIFGSFCSSLGIISCFWAEDIVYFSLLWVIFLGFGVAIAVALLQEIINRQFDKHLSTAMGVYIAGSSIGSTVLPYITKALLDYYGLPGTFLIVGGIFLNTIPLSLCLPVYSEAKTVSFKTAQNIDQTEDRQIEIQKSDNKVTVYKSHNDRQIIEEKRKNPSINIRSLSIKNRNCYTVNESNTIVEQPSIRKTFALSAFGVFLNPIFIVICIVESCSVNVAGMMLTIFIDYSLEKGLTSEQGVYSLMILSITDLVGRLGLGWITDCGFIGAVKFLSSGYVMQGLSCLMYIWSNGFVMYVVTSAAYGTMLGIVLSYSPKLFKDYIEPRERTMAVASRRVFSVPIYIASPFIIGYFKDTVKSYDGLMYLLTALSFLSAVLTQCVPVMAKYLQTSPDSIDQIKQRF